MSLGFYLQNLVKWPGLSFVDSPEVGSSFLPPTERGAALFVKYSLMAYSSMLSRRSFDETLGVLDLLDRIPEPMGFSSSPVVLDIGAKNWRYLPALKTWAGKAFHGKALSIEGCELDAYRLYPSLRTNFSQAAYFSRICSSGNVVCRYLPVDVLNYRGRADIVTWFFPFVMPEQHKAWGLPLRLFDPETLFASVVGNILHSDGLLIMANQGVWESNRTKELVAQYRLKSVFEEEIRGSLHASPYPIFLTAWTREH
jgi:hypothetical protein